MDTSVLIESFADFAKLKNIDRPTMIKILEEVFRAMIRKKYITDDNFDVIINIEKGDLEIWHYREIVANDAIIEDENAQIRLLAAQKIEEDFEVGEEVAEKIEIDDFGRRTVQTARQTLIQKVKDLEKDLLYQKYKDQVGEMVTCEVYQVLGRELILRDGDGNELSLPKNEQIKGKDRYRKGDSLRAVIDRVDMMNNNPKIILSRTSSIFLERLFESEVPEIYDGLITIKNIVRDPGERAKVAVESYDDRVDPVGACVGMGGIRVNAIVRELRHENIDIINYTENMELYIARTLSPAKINTTKIDLEKKRASVTLDQDQVASAIGRNGQNIKLASKLVGMEIDIFRELSGHEDDEEDVDLMEFTDVVEEWILEEFKRVGMDTAKSVLAVGKKDLIRRTDLEEETIDLVLETLKKEFD